MYKLVFAAITAFVMMLAITVEVRAETLVQYMSFFGGISEGRRLPRTTEEMLAQQRPNRNQNFSFRYSEMTFLNGTPARFDGTLSINSGGSVDMNNEVGSFTVTHAVAPSAATSDLVTINRSVTFQVNYRVEGSQVILTHDAIPGSWSDVVTVNGRTLTLDSEVSHFGISIIEDRTPGVIYYRGDISGLLVYVDDANGEVIRQEKSGSFHGYRSPWSATETHRIDSTINADNWNMLYQIRPSITMNKVLQYVRNEPMAISFEGNYREIMQNFVGLRYDILVAPNFMWEEPTSGSISISTPNTFEQLPAPDLTFLRGNAAEDDIRRLFSTRVLTGDPRFFQPSHAITRGQFVAAVTRAIRLPITPVPAPRGRVQPDTSIFADVPNTRPEYPYIMAAHEARLAIGRANSMFYFDYPIDRQEAFMIMVRALGLTQLGLNPTPVTSFMDDALIANWARREVSVAQLIGLAVPDADGFFHPTRQLSNGEAANIINELIEYMRVGLVSDYAEGIVNIPW